MKKRKKPVFASAKRALFALSSVLPAAALFLTLAHFAEAGSIMPSSIVPCDGLDCDVDHFFTLANNILKSIIAVVVMGSGLVFAWAGFKYMTNNGNESEIKKAHEIFKHVAIGLILALAAWLIISTLLKVLTGRGIESDTIEVRAEREIRAL